MTKINTKREYKPSDIDWLGDIPTGWDSRRIAAIFDFRNTKVSDKDFEPLSVTYGGVKKQVENAAKTDNSENRKLVKIGDIAINGRSDRKGAVGISKYDGSVSGVYHVLKLKNSGVEAKYFHYLFRNPLFSQEFFKWGRGIHDDLWTTRSTEMGHITVPLPPLETQKRIADFLDEKTRVIDALIEGKEKLIELLREKRAALITHAVTNGLNLKAKLKPSGVDWLGDIPEGWEIRRGKFIFRYKKEPNNSYQCDHILALTLRGVINKEDYEARSLTPTDYASYQIFYPDDLVFKLIDLENFQTSRVGIVPEKGIMSPAYLRIVSVAKITPRFFYWFYYSLYLQGIFNFLGMGVRSTLNQHDLLAQSVTLPPTQEQKQIADFLDIETLKIDKAVALIESQIEKLKEYRSALIYHAVTGKIKI